MRAATASTSATTPWDQRPRLRGSLHLACFFAAIPVGLALVATAPSTKARIAVAVYAVGLIALFGVSGLYHRGHWSPTWLARWQRLDHTTIFVMIAGTYTPICLLALHGWLSIALLVAAWVGAIAGGALSWLPTLRTGWLKNSLYIALGWVAIVAGPQMWQRLSSLELGLVVAGGVLFTIGAVVLGTRWPNPFPKVFGYHEVWHTFVVVAVVCHLIAVISVVQGAGPAGAVTP